MKTSPNQIVITKPDDWHLHIRDGEIMKAVLPLSYRWARRAIIMPNLNPPVITSQDARSYLTRIRACIEKTVDFEPLLTLYLTEETNAEDVVLAFREKIIKAVKLYPAGVTTNSHNGVQNITKIYPILSVMSEVGIPLLIHGEVNDPSVDIFDREAVFIDKILIPIRLEYPDLKIVMEHITTKQSVDYIMSENSKIAATITPHHLILNRNVIFEGGMRPHYYCMPVLKREIHRQALIDVVTQGHKKFFLGTDSAPHLDEAKIDTCGCAGIFNAAFTIEILVQFFDNHNALENLESFTSINGADFYKLPYNKEKISLIKSEQMFHMPEVLKTGKGPITIFNPKMQIFWQIIN